MATFNPKAFEKKLNAMDLSQTSVQTVSLWIIHHKQSIKEIVAVWIEMMKKAKMDRKLVLLYLANDVVQNSRKKAKELIVYFGKAFRETFPYLNDKKINSQVERVLKIWDERRVYEKDFVEKLRAVHSVGKKEKIKSSEAPKVVEKPPEKIIKPKNPVKPLPDDFKMSVVMNMVVSMKELESELSMQDNQIASLKLDDLEAVKQVKDRSGVNKFVKEFEESKEKLDGYCSKLSRCINDKRVLIDMLHHSETYYEAAYEEAKVIVHAYKTFGSRLSSMKRKVESKVRKLKVQWQEKKKEMEEQKNMKTEYDLEPISDAEEPSEFQAIGDLVQSGLKSLAAKKSELYEPEDPTVDNTDVLDMDLGSDSEAGTPDGPLYDPSSVMYDPNDAGKDAGDNSQQSNDDSENSTKINIPNPEDVFKNIVGQTEISTSSLFKPMGIMIDGKLKTVSLSDGNMIVGSEDQKEKSVIQMNVASTVTPVSTATGRITSSLAGTEPSRSLLNNDAVSPISDDSVPSPEGTPEGLVLEADDNQDTSLLSQSDFQQQNDMSNIMVPTMSLQPTLQNNQFLSNDQFVMVGNDSWPLVTSTAPMNMGQTSLGTISELPPPPMMQGFPSLQTTNSQLSFDQPIQGFLGDQSNLATSFVQLQQNTTGLVNQFQIGSGHMDLPQHDLQMQIQMSDSQIATGASTTPTQDESIAETVRPIDILSQLLNKGRKSKKDHHTSLSSDKDRSHSDRDREHRSKEHGRHKKSSRRKSSLDRHHSTDMREPSSDRSESSYSSSKRSHHRRKSRGHSKEKHASHSEDKAERREGSVDNLDNDSSLESYLKSPKISRLYSNDVFGNSEDGKRGDQETLDERSSSRTSSVITDSLDSKTLTIFDQRRNERQLNKSEMGKDLPRDGSQKSAPVKSDSSQGNNAEAGISDFNRQYSANSDVFLQQQKSFEGQIPLQQTDLQAVPSTEPWTPTTSTPQKQVDFYFDSRRSPTPEMDHYQVDISMSQAQQPHFIASTFQPAGNFGPVSIPQFDPQANVLYSNANITTHVSMPNAPISQANSFHQDFSLDQQRDLSMQQQNVQMAGFEMQPPIFNQQPLLQQPDRQYFQENRLNARESLLPSDQHVNILPPSGDVRFRPVEPQQISNMNFGLAEPVFQRSDIPAMQHPQSTFQPDQLLPRNDRPALPIEEPFYNQMQSRIRPDGPAMFPKHSNFRRDRLSPFAGNQDDFDRPENQFSSTFQKQSSCEDEKPGDSEFVGRPSSESHTDNSENFQLGDQQALASRNQGTASEVYQDHHNELGDFSKGQRHPNPNQTVTGDDIAQNGAFHRNINELNEPYNQHERESVRPRFPQPNYPARNRLRHLGPNVAMRGSRPQRLSRPPNFQHQRPRFRPPAPRPRLPQGYMPRRPVF